MYCTYAELLQSPGALELAQVASSEGHKIVAPELLSAVLLSADTSAWPPEQMAGAQEAAARIALALQEADALIDGYLAKRGYALPLNPAHRLVAAWSRAIARYVLHKNRLVGDGKDPIERAYRDALKLLAEVAAGRFALGAQDAVAVHQSDARFESSAPVFGRRELKGFR